MHWLAGFICTCALIRGRHECPIWLQSRVALWSCSCVHGWMFTTRCNTHRKHTETRTRLMADRESRKTMLKLWQKPSISQAASDPSEVRVWVQNFQWDTRPQNTILETDRWCHGDYAIYNTVYGEFDWMSTKQDQTSHQNLARLQPDKKVPVLYSGQAG